MIRTETGGESEAEPNWVGKKDGQKGTRSRIWICVRVRLGCGDWGTTGDDVPEWA